MLDDNANATLVGFEMNTILTQDWDEHFARHISDGTANLELRCDDDGVLVKMDSVQSDQWVGLALGSRVRVDINLRPEV